jgi:CheY-like chemotaxis protein
MKTILLVEDNEDDVYFMKRAWAKAQVMHDLHVVEDGNEAVDYLMGNGRFEDRDAFPIPALVLLDLKLPLKCGLSVLEWIRSQPHLAPMLVIIFTSSRESGDMQSAYRLGANSYLVKPTSMDHLLQLVSAIKHYWLDLNHAWPVRPAHSFAHYGNPNTGQNPHSHCRR